MNRKTTLFILFLLFYAIVCDGAIAREFVSVQSVHYLDNMDIEYDSAIQIKNFFDGNATPSTKHSNVSFGLNRNPIWIGVSIKNSDKIDSYRRLVTAQSWIDNVDVYHIVNSSVVKEWHTGDAHLADVNLVPNFGYAVDLDLQPGMNYILIRAHSYEPLVFPLLLQNISQIRENDYIQHLSSGVVYGVLMALMVIGGIMFFIYKQRKILYYSLYIGLYMVTNFAYSGYGFKLIYPNNSYIQNYLIQLFILLHGVMGLMFVLSVTRFHQKYPRYSYIVNGYCLSMIIIDMIFIIIKNQYLSTLCSLVSVVLTTVLMFLICLITLKKSTNSIYLLVAILISSSGMAITVLSCLNIIDYSQLTYNGAKYGVLIELIIMAMILVDLVKKNESERVTNSYFASYDSLTKLINRRAFIQSSESLLQSEIDSCFSLVMMDIDHFKHINDQYGHHIGDLVLEHVADILRRYSPDTELIGRWGGEELIILYCETPACSTLQYVENLRKQIELSPMVKGSSAIYVTASFGVASGFGRDGLQSLYERADSALYVAKNNGRNCVKVFSTVPIIQPE